MAWYNILFVAVFALFFVKLCISLFAGDLDLDVDLDGDIDADSSSVFSFKGILHFLVGFSTFLAAKAHFLSADMIVNSNGTVQFSFLDYVYAIVTGLLFMFLLYFGYKLAIKADATPDLPQNLLNGSNGTVYLNLGNGKYSVEAHTASGTTNVDAFYPGNLEIGEHVYLYVQDGKVVALKMKSNSQNKS